MSDLRAIDSGSLQGPDRVGSGVRSDSSAVVLQDMPLAGAADRGAAAQGMVRFTVPGNPVGKGRPRVATRGRFAQLYTPEKTASYESLVKLSAHRAMEGRPLLLDAVDVELDIRVPIPASWSQKKRAQAIAGAVRPTTKPDIDNVEKAIFDGINGVVWKDDVQVVGVSKRKRYSEAPGVDVEISLAAR